MADYAYSMMVKSVDLKPEITEMKADQISLSLTTILGQLAVNMGKSIPKLPDGGWEAVSHSVTRIGGALSVTILLRRPL